MIKTKSLIKKQYPKQYSGNRFEYRQLEDKFQVYGIGLLHICLCDNEQQAFMVIESLNFYYN